MGQDKQQLAKLLYFVKAVYDDPGNKEFSQGIQTLVLQDIRSEKNGWTAKIDEIYEYCLNKNLREQANGLYCNFPLETIVPSLIEDYVKMEEARRKNDFDEFGLHLYQQVENIVNTLANDDIFNKVYSKIKLAPAQGKYDSETKSFIRSSNSKNVANFVLIDSEKNPVAKKMLLDARDLYATDKSRLVLYIVCYHAEFQWKNWDDWKKYTSLFSDIYLIRNCVHRGGDINESEQKRYQSIHKEESQNYLKFIGALLFLIEGVQKGYPLSDKLIEFAESCRK